MEEPSAPSKRALEDMALTATIHAIHTRSGEAYGAPSIHAELADEHGIGVGANVWPGSCGPLGSRVWRRRVSRRQRWLILTLIGR